jgi:RNA polymerase sigma-70 factor (ECF subfamily)
VAEDLSQETFLRGYRTFDNFTSGSNAKAWLLTILYSIFINLYHRHERAPIFESLDEGRDIAAPSVDPVDLSPTSLADTPAVEAALDALSAEFRTALLLVDVDELSYEEAAQVMGCPIGTLRSRLFRARRLMFAALQASHHARRAKPAATEQPS